MKKKHSKYRKIWLLWVALEGLVATFAIMNSFLLLRYLYLSRGTAIPEASVSAAGSVLSAVYLPLLITLILTTGFLEHKLSANVTNLMDGLRAVAGGDYSVRLKTDKHQLLDDLCEDFNRMAEELQSVRTLREDFVNSYSHEFKTPLASIQGFAKLLQSDDITEQEREEYTQIIIDETSRLSKLSSNILRLTKLENQKTVGKKTRFSLDEQIRKILLVLEPEWSKKKIDLDIDLEDIMYVGSEELMAQIWQNIINNAIKFTPEGGKISVKLFRSEKNISAEIWDNGPSIAPDVKAKIFDKFYQGDRSRATEGNGLGLALVKRIIELSEGSIEVENDMKKGGVCFRISLPYLIEDMM